MSNDTVIRVENLSKQYRIGSAQSGYKTFRETLVDAAKAPFQRLTSSLSAPGSPLSSTDDTIWALKDVSFEVKRGEVVGIIGRNGAGKTTLLKILSRITEPTKGRVELRGRVGSLLEVGTGFHPELTGHENVYMYGAILGMDRWEVTRKFDEIVDFAGVEKFIETPVKRYSTGMYMRLAFAVAAHMETEILLVDEVLAVGDAAFQKKCLGKMESVAGEGRTVLFVSHNLAAIQGLCQVAIVLKNGKVMFNGEAFLAIEQYTSEGAIVHGAKVSIEDHAGRSSNYEVVLKNIEIRTNGVLSREVGMGESLEISFSIDSLHTVRSVGFAVEDYIGRRLFVASTNYTNPNLLGDSTKQAKIICSIPELRLVPGAYNISIYISGADRMLDQIERAAGFTVIERDVFKTGVYPSKWKGVFFSPAYWRLENVE